MSNSTVCCTSVSKFLTFHRLLYFSVNIPYIPPFAVLGGQHSSVCVTFLTFQPFAVLQCQLPGIPTITWGGISSYVMENSLGNPPWEKGSGGSLTSRWGDTSGHRKWSWTGVFKFFIRNFLLFIDFYKEFYQKLSVYWSKTILNAGPPVTVSWWEGVLSVNIGVTSGIPASTWCYVILTS